MDSDAEMLRRRQPGGPAIYFDGTSNQRRAVTLRFADRLEIRERRRECWRPGPMPISAAPTVRPACCALSCLTAPRAGAARDSRCRARGRADLALRRHRRQYARPPRRRGHRRLVARRRGLDRRRGAVRRAARRRSPDAAGAAMPSNGGSAMSPTARSRRCSAARSATNAAGQAAFAKLVNAIREAAGLDTSVQSARAVDAGSQCLRAAGRQGLSVQRTAGEGRQCRRDRGRAGARARPSQASRQHARPDPQRRHVVPDRAAVRRHHRLQRADLCVALAGHQRPIRARPSRMPTLSRST